MKLLKTLKHEVILVLPPTVFFFITFSLLVMTRRLTMREYDIPLSGFINAVVGALIVGKVVLVVDKFPFVNRYPDKPLIFNVAWKTGIYLVATLLVRYLEHLLPFLREFKSLGTAHQHLLAEVVWPHFWLIQMWLLVLFFVYVSLRELIRAIGKDTFISLFFGAARRASE
ncbi:hypothetical protein [Methyloterricola oryzae]|uniref:hypothetical protein n=1 Tax=Methyloterricola oryzae TaxID=1495050 RepID=UPI0005EACCD4|nr:hypothetical protein [Methyloterricola oryzae]